MGSGASSMIGGVGTIIGGVQDFSNNSAAINYKRQTNEALDDYQSRLAIDVGQRQEGAVRTQGAQLQAAQHTAYANAGVDANTGTAAAVQADTAGQTELDAQTVQNNAARAAWGFQLQKGNEENQYWHDKNANEAQLQSSILTGAGNIFGGATSMFGGSSSLSSNSNDYAGRGSPSDLTYGTGEK